MKFFQFIFVLCLFPVAVLSARTSTQTQNQNEEPNKRVALKNTGIKPGNSVNPKFLSKGFGQYQRNITSVSPVLTGPTINVPQTNHPVTTPSDITRPVTTPPATEEKAIPVKYLTVGNKKYELDSLFITTNTPVKVIKNKIIARLQEKGLSKTTEVQLYCKIPGKKRAKIESTELKDAKEIIVELPTFDLKINDKTSIQIVKNCHQLWTLRDVRIALIFQCYNIATAVSRNLERVFYLNGEKIELFGETEPQTKVKKKTIPFFRTKSKAEYKETKFESSTLASLGITQDSVKENKLEFKVPTNVRTNSS